MGGGMDPQDLFSQLFGGGGGFFGGAGGRGGRPSGPRKGKDLVHRIKVSLEDLYKGKMTKLALQKHVLCSKCKGKGGKEGAVKTCNSCHGQGIKIVMRQLGPMVQQIQQQCGDCNGEGEIINPKDRCKSCNGKKIVDERKVLEVHIDKVSAICYSARDCIADLETWFTLAYRACARGKRSSSAARQTRRRASRPATL